MSSGSADLLQEPAPIRPGLRDAVIDGEVIRYVPIAGTHGWRDAWCMEPSSPFSVMMAGNMFTAIRARDGRPFRWSTDLNGWRFWKRNSDWEAGADALYYFLDAVPYRDRNLIAHSHGGQVALIAASQGLEIRSLTTVGTPVRSDVPAAQARKAIGFWQHIYDKRWDFIQLLGQHGDGDVDFDRRFDLPLVLNHGLRGISHSHVLRKEEFIRFWGVNGWLRNIRESSPFRPDRSDAA